MNLATGIACKAAAQLGRKERLIGYIPIKRKDKCGLAAMSRSALVIFSYPIRRNKLIAKLRKVAIMRGPEFLRI
jgi:hypothetical protein